MRTEKGVRQRTLLNLGTHFPHPREKWSDMTSRIEDIISGQRPLFELSEELETACQHIAALIIQAQTRTENIFDPNSSDYRNVDINTLELIRPRSVAIEHVAYQTLRQIKLDKKMKELGLNKHQLNVAIGTVIGRMAEPGSELATHYWLQNQSGLGELTGYDFEKMSLDRIYQISDVLLKHKEEIEQYLYEHHCQYFQLSETITLYDLTNTYFEGSCKFNKLAGYGKSKEKRSDCPLVTLGLVLDGSGFPKRSKVFKGNASEPKTLSEMIRGLDHQPKDGNQKELFKTSKPIIVMDAGIATEENVSWLKNNNYRYLVVSRKRHREFSEGALVVKEDRDYTIKAYKKVNEETGEIELYCHSTRREKNCLRTNEKGLDEAELWRTYTMLTELEAVFRSLKSELGLRPVFHQITRRVSGHLFITMLAYHLVHTIRYQLKRKGINSSWSDLRKQLRGQDRITISMRCKNGKMIHIRKSTRPEPRQQRIYDALGLAHYPGRIVKKEI